MGSGEITVKKEFRVQCAKCETTFISTSVKGRIDFRKLLEQQGWTNSPKGWLCPEHS